MKRREFAKRAASAAAIPLLTRNWLDPSRQEAAKPLAESSRDKQENATSPPSAGQASRADELRKKAETRRDQHVAALRAKPLPYNLEPGFVFAAKSRERKRQGSEAVKR